MPDAKPSAMAVSAALSTQRMSTYLTAAAGDPDYALELYGWNARVSAALMLPAHFAEVTTRNAASDALTQLYGPNWPWSAPFTRSLPSPYPPAFNPRRNLENIRSREPSTGKVIAELKFAFWQSMFTGRHDQRLWQPRIGALFPGANSGQTPAALRSRIYGDLEAVRQLRNRIAHHEPVLSRNLPADLAKMLDLIHLRSPETAQWVRQIEQVTPELAADPRRSTMSTEDTTHSYDALRAVVIDAIRLTTAGQTLDEAADEVLTRLRDAGVTIPEPEAPQQA